MITPAATHIPALPANVKAPCAVTSHSRSGALKKKCCAHAHTPDACSGSIPQVSARQPLFFDVSAYDHTRPIATSHSTSENTCTPHVGTDSALGGPAGRPGASAFAADAAAARKLETHVSAGDDAATPRSSRDTSLESSAIRPNVLTSARPAAASTSCPGRNVLADSANFRDEPASPPPAPPSPPPPQSTLTSAPRAAFTRPSQPSPSQPIPSAASMLMVLVSNEGAKASSEASVGRSEEPSLPTASRNASITRKLVSEMAAWIRKCSASMLERTVPYASCVYASAGMDTTTNRSSVANEARISSVALGAS